MCPKTQFIYSCDVTCIKCFTTGIKFITKCIQLLRHFHPIHVRATTGSSCYIQFTQLSFWSIKMTTQRIIFGACSCHDFGSEQNQGVNSDVFVIFYPFPAVFVGIFQVKVHQLLNHGFTFCGNALVKQKLSFNFSHCAALNSRGMGDNWVEIEFVVIYLIRYSQFFVLLK